MKYIGLITAVFVFFFKTGHAQESWTLERCIDHAMKHNIDLKIQQNHEQKDIYSRQQAQWELAPSINGWGNSSIDFRRSTNQNNEIASGSSYNMNYGISSSFTLFSGFTKLNTISALRFNELAGKEAGIHASNMLTISITELYTQALYQKALVKVINEQLYISRLEAERITANVEAGLLEAVARLEIDAIVSEHELQLKKAQNELLLMKLKLAHLIEIPEKSDFNISSDKIDTLKPEENQQTVNEIYTTACQHYPAILQKEYEMAYYKKMLDISKGNASPSLTINGGYSSAFFSTDTLQNGIQTPFNTQFENYMNPSVGLSLSVPIFNGRQNDYNIKKRKIDLENALFTLENEKKTIQREIEEAILRLEALRLEYQYARNNLISSEKSFDAYRERYQLGLVTSTEFMEAQNKLAYAKSEQIRAKYSWVVQKYTLELYKGRVY
jgi:outer membrane protein